MIELVCIGNLGADAVARANDKGKFCTFDIAHTDKYRDAAGNVVESTTWVSCSFNRPDNVLPFLKKGVKVYVRGRAQARAYVSKQGDARASLNVFVDDLVLCGGGAAHDDVTPAPGAPF